MTRFCGGKGATIFGTLNYSDTDSKNLTGNLGNFFGHHKFLKVLAVGTNTQDIAHNASYLDEDNAVLWREGCDYSSDLELF